MSLDEVISSAEEKTGLRSKIAVRSSSGLESNRTLMRNLRVLHHAQMGERARVAQ